MSHVNNHTTAEKENTESVIVLNNRDYDGHNGALMEADV